MIAIPKERRYDMTKNAEAHHSIDAELQKLKTVGNEAGEKLESALRDVKKDALSEIGNIEKKIRENPVQSVAVAFAAGVFISYLLKRR